jgi:hypothetical protein
LQENPTIRNPRAEPVAAVRFPGEDGGRSLADMAQRDLDAALQLLADRAQFITGASGAAIALRRSGRSDMLCRASTGSNAPELGALLSTEFGLSGESVRTRKALRCDDAERDARVNRDVCRQLGIASVVVMPVVHDDEVLGVFELFSGKAHAFGERDLSAIQRLSQMVETAVRLARASERLPEALAVEAVSEAPVAAAEMAEPIVDVEIPENNPVEALAVGSVQQSVPAEIPPPAPVEKAVTTEAAPVAQVNVATPETEVAGSADAQVKKPLFWSAATAAGAAGGTAESDQSHVPPVLRGLRKCEACGFPVSAGRSLCVECEEKKWKGQLKRPQS